MHITVITLHKTVKGKVLKTEPWWIANSWSLLDNQFICLWAQVCSDKTLQILRYTFFLNSALVLIFFLIWGEVSSSFFFPFYSFLSWTLASSTSILDSVLKYVFKGLSTSLCFALWCLYGHSAVNISQFPLWFPMFTLVSGSRLSHWVGRMTPWTSRLGKSRFQSLGLILLMPTVWGRHPESVVGQFQVKFTDLF